MRSLIFWMLWGCSVDGAPSQTETGDLGADDPCALQLESEHWTPTWTNTRFEVEGGSGNLVYSLVASPSGDREEAPRD